MQAINLNTRQRALAAVAASTYAEVLRTTKNHESAVAALVASLGGQRTPLLLETCAMIVCAEQPGCTFRVTSTAGKLNVRFVHVRNEDERHEAAKKHWDRHFAKYLPQVKKGNVTAAKRDEVAAEAKRCLKRFSPAELRRLVKLLGA